MPNFGRMFCLAVVVWIVFAALSLGFVYAAVRVIQSALAG